jgi:4,5-dihydroxyphthalate decarboxylase
VFQKDGWIRRLVRNYREVEADYHRRTGIYPGFHVVAARRAFAEKHPQAILALYRALIASWNIWTVKTKQFAEASPWAMEELETMLRDFGEETLPFGMESKANRLMVETMCREQHAQKLVEKPARPEDLFKDFEGIRRAHG